MSIVTKNELSSLLLSSLLASPLALSAEAEGVKRLSVELIDGRLTLVEQLQFVEDSGAANRIFAGDLLRTLSQEIPAAVCHLHNNVSVEEARDLLSTSVAQFDAVTLGLLNGNEAMGIAGGETRRKTIVELEELIAEWSPVHDAAVVLLENPRDTVAAHLVYDSTDFMLEKTHHLLSELEGEYANPVELLQSDVLLLEIAGRMAAETQRMAYEACRVWSHEGSLQLKEDLAKTLSVFEASFDALRNGMPSMSVAPAPTPEIAAALDDVAGDWTTIHGYLEKVLSGEEVNIETREMLYHALAVKLHKVEEIEYLYEEYSKRVY